ncbi:MAG: hypothetical protein IJT06_02385 [Selenomonadaceae bacterium]|nr:hypothetical protein [Selenomonadaceae bacterium]
MEKGQYTIFSEQSLKNFEFNSSDATVAATDFLRDKKNFRPFDEGLTELLQKAGFRGDIANVYDKTDFLMEKLQTINSNITRKTVLSWFDGKRRPKIEPASRQKIYEICFALNLNFDQVTWFFNHVYFDRTFNCHSVAEVVYYFAFLKNISYDDAIKIIAEIEAAPAQDNFDGGVYTRLIKNRVDSIETVDELKKFLIEQKKNFSAWNKSALEKIQNLFIKIVGDEKKCKDIVKKLKRTVEKNIPGEFSFSEDEINRCGLLLRYICYRARAEKNIGGKYSADEIYDAISGRNIFSKEFVLDNFLGGILFGINREFNVPYVLKNNFPAKKILSDVLDENKASVSKSYDAIRKTLILFQFYKFWYEVALGDVDFLDAKEIEELPEIYFDEINGELNECGYESLFSGNPYDWLFMCSAQSKDPEDPTNFSYATEFFSEIVFNLTDDFADE